MAGKSKFWNWIDHRVRVQLEDKRIMIGTLIGFDKHLNLILADAEEFRIIKPKSKEDPIRELKRPLGLLILRGDYVLSITAEKSPQLKQEDLNVTNKN